VASPESVAIGGLNAILQPQRLTLGDPPPHAGYRRQALLPRAREALDPGEFDSGTMPH
jgi:hypothetical protein